jgi:multiple sugar transport system permease protein
MKRRTMSVAGVLLRTPRYVVVTVVALLFLAPLIWSAIASISPRGGTAQTEGYGFGNYGSLNEGFGSPGQPPDLIHFLTNSIIISGITVVLTLVLSILGGYAFARFRFLGKNALFILVLSILMVPYASLLIPLYVLLQTVGLGNSLLGVALVLTLFQLPFAIFMMRIAFEAIPAELEESALVDGCTTFGALRRVMLPSALPGVITVGLFSFLAAWNDFIAPLMILNDPMSYPLPLAVANLRQETMGVVDYGITQAGVVVLALPCIVLFLLLQRFYVRGFMSGALKG